MGIKSRAAENSKIKKKAAKGCRVIAITVEQLKLLWWVHDRTGMGPEGGTGLI